MQQILTRSDRQACPASGPSHRRRICLLSEDLSGAPDEGLKKFTLALARALRPRHDLTVLSTRGAASLSYAYLAPAPRSFLSRRLKLALRALRPEILVYAARSSTTFSTFLRCRLLRTYAPSSRLVLLALQPRRHGLLQRRLLPHLKPDLTLVQGLESKRYLEQMGLRADVVSSGVDTDVFRPPSPAERLAARGWLGLEPNRPVVLHVGHLRRGRGVTALQQLAESGHAQVVLVTSSSTAHEADDGLAGELRASGVRLVTSYIPRIEQVYHAADCYVFPVESTDNAIEAPLTVFEALACDLPVVSTRFGGLPALFEGVENPGLVFVSDRNELIETALRVAAGGPWETRRLVSSFSWPAVAARVVQRALKRGVGVA